MVPALMGSGRFEGHDWLIYGHITGAPWQRDSGHVAQLLGRLHDQPEFSGLPRGVNGSAALEAQGLAVLCWTIRSPEDEAAARTIAQNITFEGYTA